MIPCIFAISNWAAKKKCIQRTKTPVAEHDEILKVLPDETKTIAMSAKDVVYSGETQSSQKVPFISKNMNDITEVAVE